MSSPNVVYEQIPLRLRLSIVSNPPAIPVDQNTGLAPRVWRRQNAAIQLAIFDALNVSIDLSNLAYLQVILQKAHDSIAPIWVKQVDAADITDVVTIAAWLAGTAQQASVSLTPSDTDQGLEGNNEADFWLIVQGFTEDGAPLVYGAGALTIYDAGSVIPAQTPKFVAEHKQAADAGDVAVAPLAQIHTETVTIGGAARDSKVVLGIVGAVDGARLFLVLVLPGTLGINLSVRSGIGTNPEISAISTGSVLLARLEYHYDADVAAWIPDLYLLPPT